MPTLFSILLAARRNSRYYRAMDNLGQLYIYIYNLDEGKPVIVIVLHVQKL